MMLPRSFFRKAHLKSRTGQHHRSCRANVRWRQILATDAGAVYARARAAGEEILFEIEDKPYGGRGFTCSDLEGRIWNVARMIHGNRNSLRAPDRVAFIPSSHDRRFHRHTTWIWVYDTLGGATLDASFPAVRPYTGHVVSCLDWGSHSLALPSFRAATYSGVCDLK